MLERVIDDPKLMQPDGLHPNAAGAVAIADTIWPYLEPLVAAETAAAPMTAAPPGRRGAVNTHPMPDVLTVECGVTDLARLIRAAQGGDRLAFGELYAAYARAVHGIVLSRVPRADVDDLVQDVFVIAMQRVGTLRDPASFGGWLAAIARNRATDYLRRMPPTKELTDELLSDEPTARGGFPCARRRHPTGWKPWRCWRRFARFPMRTVKRSCCDWSRG